MPIFLDFLSAVSRPLYWLLPVLGACAGLLALAITLRNRRRKALRYFLPVRRRVFSNTYLDNEDFELTLDGAPIGDLFLVELEIQNVGTEAIRQVDIISPLTLSFDRNVQIQPIAFLRKRSDVPIGYEIAQDVGQTHLRILTPLIEYDDVILIRLLYEAPTYADYELTGRIVDGNIKKYTAYEERRDEDYEYQAYRKAKPKRSAAYMFFIVLPSMLVLIGIAALVNVFAPSFASSFVDFLGSLPLWLQILGAILAFHATQSLLLRISRQTVERRFIEQEEEEVEERRRLERERSRLLEARGHPHPEVSWDE